MWWWDGGMLKWWNESQNSEAVIWCDSISLGQKCNTSHLFPSLNTWEKSRVSDLPDINAMRKQLENLTKEVIQLHQEHKDFHNFL